MEQRLAFDQVADVYKTARPGYPEALVEHVVAYAELKQNDKILELAAVRVRRQRVLPRAGGASDPFKPKSRATPPALAAGRARQSRRGRPSLGPASRDADGKPVPAGKANLSGDGCIGAAASLDISTERLWVLTQTRVALLNL